MCTVQLKCVHYTVRRAVANVQYDDDDDMTTTTTTTTTT